MKVFPYLSGFWAQARRSAAWAALAAAWAAGTAEKAAAQLYVNGDQVVTPSSSGDGWEFSIYGILKITKKGTFLVTGNASNCSLSVGANCTVVASNLVVEAPLYLPGMGVGTGYTLNLELEGTNVLHGGERCPGLEVCAGGAAVISGNGTLEATGGDRSSGIGAGDDVRGGMPPLTGGNISIAGGTVIATGGSGGAGIGGGVNGTNGTVSISGGTVVATGGADAAGIGGGSYGAGGTISISGGTVTATGKYGGSGIGGGIYGEAGAISISGGTVRPRADSTDRDIGIGNRKEASPGKDSCTFTGGTIFTTADRVDPPPCDAASAQVFPVTFSTGTPNQPVTGFSGHVTGYGLAGVCTDDNGDVVFWLPPTDGAQIFTLALSDGSQYGFCVSIDADGTVSAWEHVFVNGTLVLDGKDSSGTGWNCSGGVVTLSDASMTYAIQGDSTKGAFRFVVPNGAEKIELVGLNLAATNAKYASALAVSAPAAVVLTGDNVLAATGNYAAGIEVASNATVTISGTGSLKATGGKYGAGIGSRGGNAPCGRIQIQSGTIVATGGNDAAGIGGGGNSNLQEGSIVISGGVVEGHGGAYAAGIGAGRGNFRVPAGAITVSGGTVTAFGDCTEAEAGSLGGSASSSDFAESLGNVVATAGGVQAIAVTGGSVVPGTLGIVSPRPVDGAGTPLYRMLMGGFEAGSEVRFTCDGLPEAYATNSLVADSQGRVCLWLPAGDEGFLFMADGKYYATPAPFKADADFADGSDTPPETIVPEDPENTNVFWRVTVPGLEPGAEVVLDIQAETEVLFNAADPQGRFFFYAPDGGYAFKANGLDYIAIVAGGPATAVRNDPETPTGVFVDGTDVCAGLGAGWSYDCGSFQLVFSSGGSVVSGSNTEGRVQIVLAADNPVTASNLALSASGAAVSVSPGRSATLVLSGETTLCGGEDHAAVEVPDGAALEIAGDGRLVAAGGSGGAGIGGGSGGSCGKVTVSGGTVTATGGDFGAGIGGGAGGAGGAIGIAGGLVTARGGRGGAGIGGSFSNSCGKITVSGGTVAASGGSGGAGIGGGQGGAGGTVAIAGGLVTAEGGQFGAGIGGGDAMACDRIAVSGGLVTASGGAHAAGIGGGRGGAGGIIAISGGTICPKGGATEEDDAFDIGDGGHSGTSGTNVFTGGAVFTTADKVCRAAVNAGGEAVWPVEITGLEPGFRIGKLSIFPFGSVLGGYGTNDLFVSDGGTVVLWLPDGMYALSVEKADYGAVVAGGPASAFAIDKKRHTGVFVDGTDACNGIGKGWTYDLSTSNLVLFSDGHVVSGSNTEGRVTVSLAAEMTLAVSNLTLSAASGAPAVLVCPGTTATLSLAGETTLCGGENHAALEVPEGALLRIGGDGELVAEGGERGAGIGSGNEAGCGNITISDGTVTATGGDKAAGIGCGNNGGGGSVAITGGTVAATGGDGAAGIGGGVDAIRISGGTVAAAGGSHGAGIGGCHGYTGIDISISGGIVTATGSTTGAGIGGGQNEPGGAISISGGTIAATGGVDASDIGSGYNSLFSGTNIFSGGSILTEVDRVFPSATNAVGAAVWRVEVAGLEPNERIAALSVFDRDFTPVDYGVHDIFASDGGVAALWLPDGSYVLILDGRVFTADVDGGPTAAVPFFTGVCVNGTDVTGGCGEGWTYDLAASNLVFSASGFILSGSNTEGLVRVSVASDITLTASNLTLSSASGFPAILVASGSATLLLAGESALRGGDGHPAVEVSGGAALAIGGGGALSAAGGRNAAGIGGGCSNSCGSIAVLGGTIDAAGGDYGAGIGAGQHGVAGKIAISGGLVTATGGEDAPGIGAGDYGTGGTLLVSGGTVHPVAGSRGDAIGGGWNRYANGNNIFTGGAVFATRDKILFAPTNGAGATVWPVEVAGLEPNARIASFHIFDGGFAPFDYGANDLFASDGGVLVLWLPDGDYTLGADAHVYQATVAGGATSAEEISIGVYVDGTDVVVGSGEGWTYDMSTSQLVLSGDGLVLSGTNTNGLVLVSVAADITLTASNLTLAADSREAAAILVPSGFSATLLLDGENAFSGGDSHPAIEVPEGASLSIGGGGALSATGGFQSAGIGGGYQEMVGTITIDGGTVTATGASGGAGIGGGLVGSVGTLVVNGGIVKASGGWRAVGIGGGQSCAGGSVTIAGGSVYPEKGGVGSYAVGDGFQPSSPCTNIFVGGTVFTTDDMVKPGPANAAGEAVQAVTVTGLTPGAPVALGGLPDYYGTESIFADDEGKVVLWLPAGDWSGVEPTGPVHVFFANGYQYTVSFVGGVNSGPGAAAAATQGEALPLERLEIERISFDGGTLTLQASAEPATWTHGFSDTLSVRQTDTLSDGAAESFPSATRTLSSDGTVSFSIPFGTFPHAAFFSISAPQ